MATTLEDEALATRRAQAGLASDAPRTGLAFSGGGIRSATFCLGVLRALARHRLVHRFDYLSTVSGGGYAGSAFGRLFHPGQGGGAAAVEEGLGRDDTSFLWWLRNNGRFLAPAGAGDLFQTWATQLRGFIATQVEVAVLAIVLACLITLPHLAYTAMPDDRWSLPVIVSLWWWLLPIPSIMAAIACYGYWFLGRVTLAGVVTAVAAGFASYSLGMRAWASHDPVEQVLWTACALFFGPGPLAWVAARISSALRTEEANRVRYAHAFTAFNGLFVLIALIGGVDMLSWYVRSRLGNLHPGLGLFTSAGIATVLLALVRAVMPLLQPSGKAGPKVSLNVVAQVLGLSTLALIVLFWTTIFQFLVFPPDQGGSGIFQHAWVRWAAAALVVVVYLLINGRDMRQLNQSSLHLFYRSRLARTYVAVGNAPDASTAARTRFPAPLLAPNTRATTETIVKVTELLPGDDVALTDYTPYRFGGPIHLVNCCINQTVDDRTGTYNADRKGVNLSVSALGVETGTHGPDPAVLPTLQRTTLAEWVAISGAALGSGMGSLTQSGTAALLFLSGLRLGYWQRNLASEPPPKRSLVAKYQALLREMLARFPGVRDADWYLSDGGHFDNTGVYALLKRELNLIVLVDCGADPDYRFADVENLVRKARIDYDASIAFIDPLSLAPLAGTSAVLFATPDTMTSDPAPAHLLLARIVYPSGAQGTLLIVKPRLPQGLPLDVAGYADREPTFPQQSTSQQFFSESQWESYCQLGVCLGSSITADMLDQLSTWAWQGTVVGTQSSTLTPTAIPPSRFRQMATTVGTSIGLGAVFTAAIAGWQAIDSARQQEAALQAATQQKTQDITGKALAISGSFQPGTQFDDGMRSKIADLLRDLASVQMPDRLRERLAGLVAPLSTVCDATTDAQQQGTCEYYANILAWRTSVPPTSWQLAMRDYDRWRDPGHATDEGVANTSAETPPAAPPPQPDTTAVAPPPPMADVAPPPPPPPPPVAMPAPAPPPPEGMAGNRPGAMPRETQGGSARPPEPTTAAAVVASVVASSLKSPPAAEAARPAPSASELEEQVRNACGQPTQPYTLYTQVYDEASRTAAVDVLARVHALGLVVPGVENVSTSASHNGTRTPFEWRAPTVLYASNGASCANALVDWANTTLPQLAHVKARAVALPPGTGKATVLELWLPRRR
ncbi:patatin-like phospholipase family protein [Bacillus sp. NP157]|nr:patatin-like phospholipase family protein [Bacillus sp. NP157]